MIKAAIACYWAATVNDRSDIHDPSYGIRWEAAKFAVRCVTTAFLMGLFMKINARAFPLRNATTKINHLLVPAIVLGIVSVFAESLIDQYVGELDKILRFVTTVDLEKRFMYDARVDTCITTGLVVIRATRVKRASSLETVVSHLKRSSSNKSAPRIMKCQI